MRRLHLVEATVFSGTDNQTGIKYATTYFETICLALRQLTY